MVKLSTDDGRAQTIVIFPIGGHVNIVHDCAEQFGESHLGAALLIMSQMHLPTKLPAFAKY